MRDCRFSLILHGFPVNGIVDMAEPDGDCLRWSIKGQDFSLFSFLYFIGGTLQDHHSPSAVDLL